MYLTAETAASVHAVFEALAMALGAFIYRWRSPRSVFAGSSFYVLLGCFIGAGIGNKLLHQLQHPEHWPDISTQWQLLLGGQSLLGGLIGGWLGVEIVKYFLKIKQSTGDAYVVPLCAAIALGRIGCFFAGLNEDTFGTVTNVPWGVDLGDGQLRHPAPLYEALWALLMLIAVPAFARYFRWPSGAQFRLFFAGYCLWRLWVETLKPAPPITHWGLSAIQWAALITLIFYIPLCVRWWQQQIRQRTGIYGS